MMDDYMDMLLEMFPRKTTEDIKEIIDLVLEGAPFDSVDLQLENVINLLCKTGSEDEQPPQREQVEDQAAGSSRTLSGNEISVYFEQLKDVFPDACPTFLRNVCRQKANTFPSVSDLIDEITHMDYPKKPADPSETHKMLCEMLPNADPSYLQKQANYLVHRPQAELKQFVEEALENEDYPTIDEYHERQKTLQEIKRYTTHFDLKAFLEEFPNPEAHFSNPARKNPLVRSNAADDNDDEEKQKEEEAYALTFLLNRYVFLRSRDIERIFRINGKSLYKTCVRLDRVPRALKVARKTVREPSPPENIPLLQEIAFLKNRQLIKCVLKCRDENYRLKKMEAKKNNLLQTCSCCFDDELIPEECYFCNNGCIFCKDCVKTGAETNIGDGRIDFPCLAQCEGEFSLSTLQMVLDKVVFLKMFQRRQAEEIKQAKLEGLETCPFCYYADIPAEEDKIFHCRNPECGKEICRECRHESHIPLRCNEIEYDEDVRMRTFIENKMTEALLRECWSCGNKFIKESGCNKMTCRCGAKMCYVCKQRVNDYTHFGDNGRCPLYTEDLSKFHEDIVIQGGLRAKSELGVDRDPKKLKKDPMKIFTSKS